MVPLVPSLTGNVGAVFKFCSFLITTMTNLNPWSYGYFFFLLKHLNVLSKKCNFVTFVNVRKKL